MKIKAESCVFMTLNNGIKIFLTKEDDSSTSYDLWYAPADDEWYDDDPDDGGIIETVLFHDDGTVEIHKETMDFILQGTEIQFSESLVKSYSVDDHAEHEVQSISDEPFTCDNAFDYIVAQIKSELDYDHKPYSTEYCLGEQIFCLHADDGTVTVRVQVSARNKPLAAEDNTRPAK